MKMTLILFIMLLPLTTGYFNYDDCAEECKLRAQPCVIYELNPTTFQSSCETDETTCELDATPDGVCLRRGKSPLGGERIWNDYQKMHPTTPAPRTTTSAPPPKNVECKIALWYSSIMSALLLLCIAGVLLRKCLRWMQDRHYEPLINPGEGHPYQPTTVEI